MLHKCDTRDSTRQSHLPAWELPAWERGFTAQPGNPQPGESPDWPESDEAIPLSARQREARSVADRERNSVVRTVAVGLRTI